MIRHLDEDLVSICMLVGPCMQLAGLATCIALQAASDGVHEAFAT